VTTADPTRTAAYGQHRPPSIVDRFGVWLSARTVKRFVPTVAGARLGDFGCGYQATIARALLPEVAQAVLADLALAPDLKSHPRIRALEGALPAVLAPVTDASLDIVLCLSVLEHLWQPEAMLAECRRVLAPGGVLLVNVPSWRGKRALEFSAFRLGLSPAEEMDDHKAYYDPRDLWPLLVRAGFVPHDIRCFRHKFGLNTFAVCRTGKP
jgi:SAM-dependent methyltransferase